MAGYLWRMPDKVNEQQTNSKHTTHNTTNKRKHTHSRTEYEVKVRRGGALLWLAGGNLEAAREARRTLRDMLLFYSIPLKHIHII